MPSLQHRRQGGRCWILPSLSRPRRPPRRRDRRRHGHSIAKTRQLSISTIIVICCRHHQNYHRDLRRGRRRHSSPACASSSSPHPHLHRRSITSAAGWALTDATAATATRAPPSTSGHGPPKPSFGEVRPPWKPRQLRPAGCCTTCPSTRPSRATSRHDCQRASGFLQDSWFIRLGFLSVHKFWLHVPWLMKQQRQLETLNPKP